MEILGYSFFQNALIGSLFACIACGIIGTYIVTRRLVFISGGITHSGFGGVGLGMFLGINPMITAFLFAAASALGVGWLKRKDIREDSAIAIFWILGMSLGIIFCFLSSGYSSEMSTYLFGNILTINSNDITILAIISASVVLTCTLLYRPILAIAFDSEFAKTKGLPVALIESIMMLSIAITIVSTLRIIGVVLVMAMLTVPQMTALLFTESYRKTMWLSIIIGYISTLAGLTLSYNMNTPSGATIVLCSIAIYAACRVIIAIYRNRLRAKVQ
ncbi:MAG: metal ABC transporter permease [Bacteroidaceae bacterium]|nr:metal ABC transporter permease [Bacteroidaceae bacterium]